MQHACKYATVVFTVVMAVMLLGAHADWCQAQNLAPVANAGADQNVSLSPGQTTVDVTLDGNLSSDPDGTVVQYIWSGTPNPPNIVTPTVRLELGTYTFTLFVDDNNGARSAPDTVTIVVNPTANIAPVADAGPNQNLLVPAGQTTVVVTLNGNDSSDADGAIAEYIWSGTPDPADVASPAVTLAPGTYVFRLVVQDDRGASSAPNEVTITVVQRPVANAGANRRLLLEPEQTTVNVTLDGSASRDPDGTVEDYRWTGTPNPADRPTPTLALRPG